MQIEVCLIGRLKVKLGVCLRVNGCFSHMTLDWACNGKLLLHILVVSTYRTMMRAPSLQYIKQDGTLRCWWKKRWLPSKVVF